MCLAIESIYAFPSRSQRAFGGSDRGTRLRVAYHFFVHRTATNKIGRRATIAIARVFDCSSSQIEKDYRNAVAVLIGNYQKLSACVKLKMTRSLSSCGRIRQVPIGQCELHFGLLGVL